MRFQYLLSLSIFTAAVTQALPCPFRPSDLAIRNIEDDNELLLRNFLEIERREPSEDLVYHDFSLVPRDKTYSLKNPVVKKTAEQAKKRKDSVRHTVEANQAAKALRKVELQQKPPRRYGKPRPPAQKKEIFGKDYLGIMLKAGGTKPGYRAKGREKGTREKKQSKTPKPNMVKGQAKSLKAQETQAASLARKRARLREGRKKFQAAAAAQKNTLGLPDRKARFIVPGGGTHTGRDVRVANFNSHLFKAEEDKVGYSPKPFYNRIQGPADLRTRPLQQFNGVGYEFPLMAGQRAGYQGGEKGPARLVTEDHTTADGKTVGRFAAVVAHDVTRSEEHPGHKDHFQIHPV